MAAIISHPFRLDRRGHVATVDQDSPAGVAEQLAVLALTRTRERAYVPAFGIPDPVFAGFDGDVLAGAASVWGPPADIRSIDVTAVDDATQAVTVSFA